VIQRFATDAREVVTSALEETRRRGDRRIGTEHLLLALLHDPRSAAAQALGIDLETARATLDALDQAALASLGIDVQGIERPGIPGSRKRTPLTSGARSALGRAVKQTAHSRSRRIKPQHMLLALLDCESPDPAAELMAQLGIDRASVRDRIRA
jgi:ATP-dependent Clp protease ATP-binding subunit ClpA